MALKTGSKAPLFSLPNSEGNIFELSEVKSSIIIYFYPKDFTPGCTKEACSFRDNFDFFSELNIPVIGISTDSVKKHKDFKQKYQLPFELLSDIDGKISKKYDALIPLLNISKRITYLVDADLIIKGVYESLLGNEAHIHKMIELVNESK